MVNLDVVQASTTTLVQSQPLVAVFFGGTSGIGHYTLRALATAEASNGKSRGFRAYIVGRNASAAAAVTAECRSIYPAGKYVFVQASDLSLLKDVDRVCKEIIELEGTEGEREGMGPRIDYLMLSQGGAVFLPRKDTKEGLDVTMSLMYYSRMRAITQLLPLLLKSPLPARVVSVFAAGTEAKLYADDLSLRDLKKYSYLQARSHMVYMHTLFFETLAAQHPSKLSLIHIFPGLVLGPTFSNPDLPAWFRVIFRWLLVPLFGWWATVKPEKCGMRMLSLASERYPAGPGDGDGPDDKDGEREGAMVGTDGKAGSGVYSLTWNGEDNLKRGAYAKIDKREMRGKVWKHTMRAFEVIEGGKVFAE